MKLDAFLRELEALLELDANSLKGDEVLEDTGMWDSLTQVSFMAMVDEKFGLTLPAEKIAACKTVPELVALVGGKIVG